MEQIDLFLLFTRPLDAENLLYMTTGSVAAMMYGMPRFTHDLDLVLDLGHTPPETLAGLFPDDSFYRPPSEVIRIEASRGQRGHFNLIHHETGMKADVYLRGSDPLHAWALERRRRIELNEHEGLWLAPPEYVILRKLQYYREGQSGKHLSDIRGILDVSGDQIQHQELKTWLEQLQLQDLFSKV